MKQRDARAVCAETYPSQKWHYLAIQFIMGLILLTTAFTALASTVIRTAFFTIDLQITQSLQSFEHPIMTLAMELVGG